MEKQNTKNKKLQKIVCKKYGEFGSFIDCVDYIPKYKMICIGDKNGSIHLISMKKMRLLKNYNTNGPVTALKHLKFTKDTFFTTAYESKNFIGKISINSGDVRQKKLDYFGHCLQTITKDKLVAVSGAYCCIYFFNQSLEHIKTFYHSEYQEKITTFIFSEIENSIIGSLSNGTFFAFKYDSLSIIQHDYSQKTSSHYICSLEDGRLLVSVGSEGRIHIRDFNSITGFKSKSFYWMKEKEVLGLHCLKAENYFACIHDNDNSLDIIKLPSWQLVKSFKIFKNPTGCTNFIRLGDISVFALVERGEGILHIIRG